MQAFVDAVNGFVRAPADANLSAGYGSVGSRFKQLSVLLGLVFMMFVYSLPRVRVTADRVTERLVFDIRPFGPLLARRRSYPLPEIREARVSGRGTLTWVELVLTNGTTIRLPGSVAPRGPCRVLAKCINDALGAESVKGMNSDRAFRPTFFHERRKP